MNFFNVYGNASQSILSRAATWPVLGNHDTYSWMFANPNTGGYATAFGTSLPQNGEALNGGPGVPSGTWRYYSWNWGRTHFVALDSMTLRSNTSNAWGLFATSQGTSYPSAVLPASVQSLWASLGSPVQAQWLAADLASVAAAPAMIDHVIAFYHHPPHSAGSHFSDKEIEQAEMRALYNPILEAGGTDLVFHGHSHQYERMKPSAGAFAYAGSSQFNLATQVMPTTASSNANGPITIQNKAAGVTPNSGTTYIVAGSGGQLTATAQPSYNLRAFGINATVSCALDIVTNTITVTCMTPGAWRASERRDCAREADAPRGRPRVRRHHVRIPRRRRRPVPDREGDRVAAAAAVDDAHVRRVAALDGAARAGGCRAVRTAAVNRRYYYN